MMVEYKLFKDSLEEIKAVQDFKTEVLQAIRNLDKKNIKNLDTDFMGEETIMIAHDQRVVELLARLFADNDDEKSKIIEDIIYWYIYDTEWGKINTEVTYSDGSKVNINTLEKLYWDITETLKTS